jgi:hypothetical protein
MTASMASYFAPRNCTAKTVHYKPDSCSECKARKARLEKMKAELEGMD